MQARKLLLAVVFFSFAICPCFADIIITADIHPDSTDWLVWGPDETVEIMQHTNILDGASVSVLPGVVILFHEDYYLTVQPGASFNAHGTPDSLIEVTQLTGTYQYCIIIDGSTIDDAVADFAYCTFSRTNTSILILGSSIVNIDCCYFNNYTWSAIDQGLCIAPERSILNITNCYFNTVFNNTTAITMSDYGVVSIDSSQHVMFNNIYNSYCGINYNKEHNLVNNSIIINNNTIINCTYGIITNYIDTIENNIIYDSNYSGVHYTGNTDYDAIFRNNAICGYGNFNYNYGFKSDSANVYIDNCYIDNPFDTIYDDRRTHKYNIDSSFVTWPSKEFADTLDPKFTVMSEIDSLLDFHLQWDSPLNRAGYDDPSNKNPSGTRASIGVYGGANCPEEEYYMTIQDTLPHKGSITTDSPYHVLSDLVIPTGKTFTIDVDYDTTEVNYGTTDFLFYDDVEVKVFGTLNIEGLSGYPIKLTSIDSLDTWDKIIATEGSINLNHVVIENAETGVALTAYTSSDMNDVTIKNCTNYGIYVSSSSLDKTYGKIENCDYGIYYAGCTNAGTIDTTIIEGNNYGLVASSSSPVITRSVFVDNSKNGMRLLSGSNAILGNAKNGTTYGNLFQNNGAGESTTVLCSELYIHSSYPNIKKSGNDFVDPNSNNNNNNIYLIYSIDMEYPPTKLELRYNYLHGDMSRTYPVGWLNNIALFDTTAVKYYPEYQRYRETYDYDALHLAISEELSGKYESAAQLYWNVVETECNPTALSGWVRCQERLEKAPCEILEVLHTLEDNVALEDASFWLQIPLQNRIGAYKQSIEELDNYIDNAMTIEDSSLGYLAQLNTYYEMAMVESKSNSKRNDRAVFSLSQLGKHSYSVPASEADYVAKTSELQKRLSGYHGTLESLSNNLPTSYELRQNYPNPFNPTTTLSFDLVRPETVKLSVYNIMGQEVAKLVDRPMQAGTHNVTFDASQLASGMYFYRIEAGSFTDLKQMVLVK